jgi:hypothetical protein
MQRFDPALFAYYSHFFGSNKRSVDEKGNIVTDMILPDSARDGDQILAQLLDACTSLGLPVTAASVTRLAAVFRRPHSTQGDLTKVMQEVHGRLIDELSTQYFLALSPSEASRFDNWRSGWEKILARFGTVTRDVEEMNKCFALGRYTASMFHALHVAEWGAIGLGNYIGVGDPKKGWGATEKKLRGLVDGGHTKLPATLTGKFDFLEQMNREIESMVLAWRHKVDHAVNHLAILPNTDFTPDVAEHIVGAVRIFMIRLMDGLPANQ